MGLVPSVAFVRKMLESCANVPVECRRLSNYGVCRPPLCAVLPVALTSWGATYC